MRNIETKSKEKLLGLIDDNQKNVGKGDVKKLMQILHITEDIELQVKLFSILALHVVSNHSFKAEIITNDSMYNKIHNILSKGSQTRAARTLNFVCALLYIDEDEGPTRARSLALHAQNMLRGSGCLAVMSNLFTSTMLHQETWKALCLCLAECCQDSHENKLYCSHLVPLCVEKCIHGNVDALATLKSLISNQEYNIKLFFDSNGIYIFKREELLQYDITMQLLNLVIQQAPTDMLDCLFNIVFQNLEHFKKQYGTQAKIGQWAIVNLHRINSRMKNIGGFNVDLKMDNHRMEQTNHNIIDMTHEKADDTAKLIQNVLKEFYQFKTQDATSHKMPLFSSATSHRVQNNAMRTNLLCQKDNKNWFFDKISTCNEMSFSFLLNKQSREVSVIGCESNKNDSFCMTGETTTKVNSNIREVTKPNLRTQNISSRFNKVISRDNILSESMAVHDDPSILNFKPIFVSTPKHSKEYDTAVSMINSTRTNRSRNKCLQRVYKAKIKHLNNSKQIVNSRKDLKQRSMGSRFFDAINDSCTTFVKTVKSMFIKTENRNANKREQESTTCTAGKLDTSCSYSFTNYMRKRDVHVSTERSIDKSMICDNKKFCKTCDDTRSLKRKVMNNSYLKETVTKLKLGINLYGCDFRKISRAMWPREKYMTPEVLYTLYRKLIVK